MLVYINCIKEYIMCHILGMANKCGIYVVTNSKAWSCFVVNYYPTKCSC